MAICAGAGATASSDPTAKEIAKASVRITGIQPLLKLPRLNPPSIRRERLR
jgi:hypothetical protein